MELLFRNAFFTMIRPRKPQHTLGLGHDGGPGWRFWVVLFALGITSLGAAVESTVISTALPLIRVFANAYTLTSQIADIFGRRWITIGVVAAFALGSGTSGGAREGGIILMIEMIVCDLVPLRDRGHFTAVRLGGFGIVSSLGPFIGGTIVEVTFILIAFSYGGTRYVWSDWQELASPWCVEPVTPLRLFQNRTSAVSFYLTFINSLLSFWVLYFLSVYFQAVQLKNRNRSGVLVLPTAIVIIPGSIIGCAVLSKFGKYKIAHLGVALLAVGTGTFILFDQDSSLATYISLKLVARLGSGLLLAVLLPAVQAALTEKDTALSTATWSFIRTFGTIWGASKSHRSRTGLSTPTSDFLLFLTDHTREQVVRFFCDSLNLIWIVATAIAGASFLIIFLEKDITLRT
ncbi:MFS general substrate transporter [Xylaria venustula]|nr:MFS general substrate transporter [Xylaria venustula]